MGSLFSDAPEAPDPYATAAAQAGANKETAAYNTVANRYNTFTPFGSHTWDQYGIDPDTGAGLYDEFIDLSPQAQANVDQNIANSLQLSQFGSQLLGNASNMLTHPIDQSSLPQYRYDFNNDQQAQDAVYNRATSYLDPQFEQEQQKLSSRLANQGIPMGSEAYNQAMDAFSRQKQMAYGNARNEAVTQGFQQGLARNQNYNNNVSQELNKQLQLYNQPLNQYTALANGSQVQVPTFQQTPVTNLPNVDLTGLINQNYQTQLGQYNANVGSTNQLLGTLTGAAITAPKGTFSSLFSGGL